MTGPAWSTDWGPCITNTWGCSPPPFPYAIKQNCRWPAQMIVKSVSRGSNNHGPHTCPSLKRSAAVWFKCSRSWRTWLLMGMGDDTWSGLIYFMPRIISMIRLKLKRLKLWNYLVVWQSWTALHAQLVTSADIYVSSWTHTALSCHSLCVRAEGLHFTNQHTLQTLCISVSMIFSVPAISKPNLHPWS